MNIVEFRQKYPDYDDMSDQQLADSLYRKFYSDMDRGEFDAKFLGSGPQPATAVAPVPAPQQPEADTYLTRSAEGLGRFLGAIPDIARAARHGAEGIAGQFVQGATLNWADEVVGKGISAITGEPYENIRRDIEGIGQDLPAGARIGAQAAGAALTGGAAVKMLPWLGTYLGNALAGTVGATADAVGRASPGEKMRELMNPWNPALGLGFSLGMQPLAAGVNRAVRGAVDKWSQMHGGVANPYLGTAGRGAQEALASSVELGRKANPGAPELNASSPLLAQDLAEGAANVAKEIGGNPLATQVGAAKGIRQAAADELAGVAGTVDDIAMGQVAQGEAQQRAMTRGLSMTASAKAAKAETSLDEIGKRLAAAGQATAQRGQQMISEAARRIAGTGQNIGREGVQKAGARYQDIGIVPVGLRTTPEEIMASPVVQSNAISKLLENPDVKKVVSGMQKDVRFEGVDPMNLTFLNELTIQLGDQAGGLRSLVPVKATRLDSLRASMMDAMEGAVPGYKEAAAGYRQASTLRSAYDMGYGFDTKKISKEELDALPPEARSEAVAAMAQRFSDLIAPQGGQAQTPAQVAHIANRLKATLSLTFGKDADPFVSEILDGVRKVQAGKAATDIASRGMAGAKPGKVRDAVAPLFNTTKEADEFIASLKAGRADAKAAKGALSQAEAGFSPERLARAREKISGVFDDPTAADDFISSVADALSKKERGKGLSAISEALRSGRADGAREALAPIVGDEAAGAVVGPAEGAARRFALAERVGANMTAIPPEKKTRWLDILRNSISGSIPGIQTRGAIAAGSHVERLATAAADRKIAERVVQILAETDQKKIEAAIRLLNKDFSSARLRAAGMLQGQNALDLWREEAR